MSKEDTKSLQGAAIILMFLHHLYGCGTFLVPQQEMWMAFNREAVIRLGAMAKICVALYVLVSGYSLYKSYMEPAHQKRSIFKRMISFLLQYWIVLFLVAIPTLLFLQKFDFSYLGLNLLALLHNDQMLYISFSWYIKLYFLLLCLVPLLRRIQLSKSPAHFILEVLLYIVLPMAAYILLNPFFDRRYFINWSNFIGSTLMLVAGYLPLFYLGVLLAKYEILSFIFQRLDTKPLIEIISGCLLIYLVYIFRFFYVPYEGRLVDLLYGPMFLTGFLAILHGLQFKWLNKLFLFLGTYNFQYWLLSGMFFLNTVELQWILFLPRYWLACVLWAFLILTPIAMLLKKISDVLIQILFPASKAEKRPALK